MNYFNQLKRQISFLQRSVASYDDGYTDEAIRIAVTIRVLIHQTKNSTSLLSHLNSTHIKLRSSTIGDLLGADFFFGLGCLTVGSSGMMYAPLLNQEIRYTLSVQDWWDQIVYVVDPNKRISRKIIILTAANQDGGAHVDSSLNSEYAELSKSGSLGTFSKTVDGIEQYEDIEDAHFVAIRQMGHELLNSEELMALVNPEQEP